MHMTGTDAASRSDTWAPLISLSDVLRFLSGFFLLLCAHVHNISPFGILLRFICFSSSLCQGSRLAVSQVKEKSHGWVCLAFLVCSSSSLFSMHDALWVDRNHFPHPSFFSQIPFFCCPSAILSLFIISSYSFFLYLSFFLSSVTVPPSLPSSVPICPSLNSH